MAWPCLESFCPVGAAQDSNKGSSNNSVSIPGLTDGHMIYSLSSEIHYNEVAGWSKIDSKREKISEVHECLSHPNPVWCLFASMGQNLQPWVCILHCICSHHRIKQGGVLSMTQVAAILSHGQSGWLLNASSASKATNHYQLGSSGEALLNGV